MKSLAPLNEAIQHQLLPWFDQNQRMMPWRKRRTPYRVWISELMLQQTRVAQAIPYYQRFMRRFPSLKKLAEASQSEVLKAWEGLGYYSRARNLHKAAQIIRDQHSGRFPCDPQEISKLPGVGPYTTAAIGSLAFNLNLAVVDGNVMRVLARLRMIEDDIAQPSTKKKFQKLADQLLVKGEAGKFNEALMELGATVCLPQNPSCDVCPLSTACQAKLLDDVSRFPVKQKKKRIPHIIVGAAVVHNRDGKILVAQRRNDQMLGGLWEFPGGKIESNETIEEGVIRELNEELGISISVEEKIITVKHTYSHFTMEMHTFWARIESGTPVAIECQDVRWKELYELSELPFSKADLKVIDALKANLYHEKKEKM
ncbi:MAG: A/G-specific adenine glycosylase [Kiritimatiellaceae bacterium TMED266]|nr:MAG: A/G-specific adenine glycosylase [Kiritimatiellaceae bacterium TMED266]